MFYDCTLSKVWSIKLRFGFERCSREQLLLPICYYQKSMKIKCAYCGKETEWENNEFRPFCSERCQMIDLGVWIDEGYRIPDETTSDEERLIHLQIDEEIEDELKKLRDL